MNFFFFLTSIIILSSFVAKAASTDCQEKLKNKRIEMNVISSNIANLNTTRTPDGGPYQRQELICSDSRCEIIKKQDFLSKFEPDHPDADDCGYVKYPNIEIMDEMSNMIKVTRDYEEVVANCK